MVVEGGIISSGTSRTKSDRQRLLADHENEVAVQIWFGGSVKLFVDKQNGCAELTFEELTLDVDSNNGAGSAPKTRSEFWVGAAVATAPKIQGWFEGDRITKSYLKLRMSAQRAWHHCK